jgi:4-hydroxy-2-oxoheptanedioate aldolase
MRNSRVRRRWAEGKPVFATVAHFNDPQSAELIGLLGIDCLWIDLEHQPLGINQLENMIRAARVSDMDVMARPAKGEFMRLGRLLEAGASVIMYPRCESAKEAHQLVMSAKFPPVGERGVYTAAADNPYCLMPLNVYLRHANEQTVIVAQIESPQAATQARAIAEVEGIDMLFFGPGDFSVAAGVPGDFASDAVRSGMAETARQALAAGKRFGTVAGNLEDAKRVLDLGATLVAHSGDLHMVRQALIDIKRNFRELGFAFNDVVAHSAPG